MYAYCVFGARVCLEADVSCARRRRERGRGVAALCVFTQYLFLFSCFCSLRHTLFSVLNKWLQLLPRDGKKEKVSGDILVSLHLTKGTCSEEASTPAQLRKADKRFVHQVWRHVFCSFLVLTDA